MSISNKQKDKKQSQNNTRRVLSVEKKKAIVKEIRQKGYTFPEAAIQYKTSISTVVRWCRSYAPKYFSSVKYYSVIDESIKRRVAREIEAGLLTVEEATLKYKVKKKDTIVRWCKKYASINVGVPMKKLTTEEKEEVATLKRELEQARLKINGLETMIDVAEVELNIEIRKKSGTKQ